jgi:hypothetical protein
MIAVGPPSAGPSASTRDLDVALGGAGERNKRSRYIFRFSLASVLPDNVCARVAAPRIYSSVRTPRVKKTADR